MFYCDSPLDYLRFPVSLAPTWRIEEPASRPRKQRRVTITNHIAIERYEHYTLSGAWRKRRKRKLKSVKHTCERCGSKVRLQVHHKHYRTVGREKNSDLEVLCESCHDKHHEAEILKFINQ